MSSKKPDKIKQQPLLDRSKANDLNLTVLRRIDSNIEEVLASASAVCLYRMSVEDQQWQRKNIEGSLFLIKRRTQPRFQMLVLNKLSTDNYIENVHGGLEMESNPPYLMYTHGNDEIHGIWFYDETELQRVSALLQKILNQLPKPAEDPVAAAAAALTPPPHQAHYQPAPTPAVQQHAEPTADGCPAAGGDAFWDKSVHVTEETLPSTQQLVPNSSLLTPDPVAGPSAAAGSAGGGLQGLLMAAQQRAAGAQRAPSATPPPAAASPAPSLPLPNSSNAPAEPAAAAASPGLLTPAFFEQQKAKQQQPVAAAASSSAPVPVPQSPAPVAAAAGSPAANGGGNALHQLLSRAAKVTPSGPTLAAAAAAAAGSVGGAARGPPQPPIGVLSPEVVHEKVKAALIRLANNDAFVDILAQEMRTVGLLQ